MFPKHTLAEMLSIDSLVSVVCCRPNLQYGVRLPPGTDLTAAVLVEQSNVADA